MSISFFQTGGGAGRAVVSVVVAVVSWWGLPAGGEEVVKPSSVVSSTAGTDLYAAANLINGSGLSGTPTVATWSTVTHVGASASTAWVTAASGSDWYAVVQPPPVLTLGLPGDFSLTGLVVWGYPSGTSANNNEAKTFVTEFSTDGGATWGGAVTLTHARTARASEKLEFAARSANAVRLTLTDNHFGTAGAAGGDRVGLGEVRFLGTAVVRPDPVVAVSAELVDFGSTPADPGAVTKSLTITNAGPELPLVVNAVSVAGPDAGWFQIGSLPGPIAAGASASLDVTFRADGRSGRFAGWLRIESNDPRSPRVERGVLAAVDGGLLAAPQPPVFSQPPGTFGDPFTLDLTTPTPGALMVFTTDGSAPGLDHGRPWTGPLAIAGTTRVRAATVVSGQASPVAGAGYIKLSAALRSKTSPLPILVLENFGAGPVPDKGWTVNTQTGAGLRQRPRQPVMMSLHERSAAGRAPLLGASSLYTRAGLRVRGAFSSTWSPQPYSLESWNEADGDAAIAPLGLPAESDWVLYHPHPSYDATMMFNTYIWELSRRTGRYAPAFRHVEVYLNDDGGDLEASDRLGLYALVESVKRDANRLDFEPLSADGATGGWLHSINRMDAAPEDGYPAANGAMTPQFFRTPGPNRLLQTVANNPAQVGDDLPRQYNAYSNFESPGGYDVTAVQRAAIEGWFKAFEAVLYDNARWRDPVNGYRQHLNTRDFIDYFQLLNLARQGDGLLLSMYPWVSSGERRLHMGPMWDFNNGSYHLSGSPSSTLYFRQDQLWYPRLFADPDFVMEYTDRWFELRAGPYANAQLTSLADTLASDITTEMAVAQGVSASSWTSRLTSMKNFLVQRANWIDTQYVPPPVISPATGPRPAPLSVTLAHHGSATGTLYFTTDGSDPRAPGGIPSGTAYAEPLTLGSSAVVKARTRTGGGRWSALAASTFILGQPASAENLVVSEIHYNPPGAGDAGEFLELMNVSPTPIDLTGVRFDRGIQFAFPAGTTLGAGERAVLAARADDFAGTVGVRVLGTFEEASRLDNGGEWLRLTAWDGTTIAEFAWDDDAPWPAAADGDGPSLTLVAPQTRPDYSQPENWRASTAPGGTPGTTDARTFAGDPTGDDDGDGLPDLCAYVFGSDLPGGRPRLPSVALEAGRLVVQVPVDTAAEEAEALPEWSVDLQTWTPLATVLPVQSRIDEGGGRVWWRFESLEPWPPAEGYLRVRVQLR